MSKVDVFTRLALDLLETRMDLTPLMGFTDVNQPTAGMPSLVHDWGEFQSESICPSFWNHFHRSDWYEAYKGCETSLFVSPDHLRCHVDGHRVDTIAVVIAIDHIPLFWANEERIDQRLVQRLEAAVQIHHWFDEQYVDMDVTYEDAFWRTIVGDLMRTQTGMPPIRWADSNDKLRFQQFVGEDCPADIWDFNCASIQGTIAGYKFFLTSQGFLGVGPKYTKIGDEVGILYPNHTPFTLRHLEKVIWITP